MTKRLYNIGIMMRLLLITVMSAMMLASCASESELNDGSGKTATIKITMQVPQEKNVSTRALNLSSNESTVNDLTVLIFNSDNQLIGEEYTVSPTGTNNTYQISVDTREATGCTVYAVANAGANAFTSGNGTVSGVSNPVNTVDEFKSAYAQLSAASDLGSQNNVIMQGVLTNQSIKAGTQTLATPVPLYRLCTKMNFDIKPASDITITGYQLHEVPASSYIADRSTETTPVYNPTTSTDKFKDFDAVTASSPTAGVEVTDTYYIYENLAGTVSASSTAKARNSTNAPATASYLDVYATGTNWKSTYRIYLGGTGTTDYTNYNILRNYNYTYTINITGSGIYDVRVTCYPELINSSTAGTWGSNGDASAVTSSATATPGMYYFNDGTWGTLEDRASATVYPIGVVFSGTTSANDQAHGWTHGYALALTNAPTDNTTKTCLWAGSTPTNYQSTDEAGATFGSFVYEDYNSYASLSIDEDGYCETQAINSKYSSSLSSAHPAFYYALNYGTNNTNYATPTNNANSGWYLPSAGQWYDIVTNLGGMSPKPTSISTYCGQWYNQNSGSNSYAYICASNINNLLSAISGYTNYGYDSFYTNSNTERYWCSSGCTNGGAYGIFFNSDGSLNLNYTSKGDIFMVRSVVAF